MLNIIHFLTLLLENIKDQYIPLIKDFLPYLHNLIDHQSVEVIIIYKYQLIMNLIYKTISFFKQIFIPNYF